MYEDDILFPPAQELPADALPHEHHMSFAAQREWPSSVDTNNWPVPGIPLNEMN
jgi:hypothetical protein